MLAPKAEIVMSLQISIGAGMVYRQLGLVIRRACRDILGLVRSREGRTI